MGSADDRGDTASAKFLRQGVGVRSSGCVGGDANEVDELVEIDPLDNLIRVADLPIRRRPGREQRHGELRESNQSPVTHKERRFRLRGDQLDAVAPGRERV